MFEPLIILLAIITVVLLILGAWAATIAFVYWDTRRRNLPGRQQFNWVVLSLFPFVGFIVYLLNRQDQAGPPAPKKRVTMLKPRQSAERRPPTIVAAEQVQVAEQDKRDLMTQVEQAPTCVLSVRQGPHQGQEFVVDQLPALIGRGADVTVRLDQDRGVSRQHAELYQQQGVLRLRDLNSTHGTNVNDQPIVDKKLVPGDTIRVGLSLLAVKRKGELLRQDAGLQEHKRPLVSHLRNALLDLVDLPRRIDAGLQKQIRRSYLFRRSGPVLPADVNKHLEKAMLARENILEDADYTKIVPNDYIVELNNNNYKRNYEPIAQKLCERWQARLLEVLNTMNDRWGRREYKFSGHVRIRIRPVSDLEEGEVRIWCQVNPDVDAVLTVGSNPTSL